MKSSFTIIHRVALLMAAGLLSLGTALAADLYWKTDSTNGTIVTAWGTTAQWAVNADGTGTPSASPGVNDNAVFSSSLVTTGAFMALNGNRTTNGIIFNSSVPTNIRAHATANTAETWTLGAGGITINSGAGAVTTYSNSTFGALTWRMTASQNWYNNSSNVFTVGGNISSSTNSNNTLTLGGSGSGGIITSGVISDNATTNTITSLNINATGSGTVTLNNTTNNTYSGATTVTAGTVILGHQASLGLFGTQTTVTNGTTILNGGTVDLNGKTVQEPFTISGTGAGGQGALINSSGTAATINNGLAGVTVANFGTQTPGALPTISIDNGGAGSGGVIAATGTVDPTTAVVSVNSGTQTYTTAPSVSFSGGSGLTGTAVLTGGLVTGINISGATNKGYQTGTTITLTGGTVSSAGTAPTASFSTINYTFNGIKVTSTGSGYTDNNPTYTFATGGGDATVGQITLSGVTLAGDTTIGAGDITINGKINESVASALTKIGTGTLKLAGNNSYTGVTTISEGKISVAGNNALGTTAGNTAVQSGATLVFGTANVSTPEPITISGTGVSNSGAIQAAAAGTGVTLSGAITLAANAKYQGDSGSSATMSGGVSLGSNTLTINLATSSLAISTNPITGTGGVTQSGSGTLTLSAANEYTGNTTVSGGTLLVNGSLAAGSAVSVANAAAIGGSGTVNGSLDFASGANLVFSATDTLTVNGNVTFGAFGISNLLGLTSATPEATYLLINGTGANISQTNVSNIGIGNFYDLGSNKIAYFDFANGDLQAIVTAAVPEPSTYAAIAGLAALVGVAMQRRRSKVKVEVAC